MEHILSFLLLIFVCGTLFINLDPAFGGNSTKEQKEGYRGLNNYVDGKFVNEIPTSSNMSFSNIVSMLKDSFQVLNDVTQIVQFLFLA